MVDAALARARLVSQGLVVRRWERPVEVATAFGAHQGQDLPGVLASIALRSDGGIEAVVEACTRGEIVRGYPMRGTVFLLAAADARWITQLCVDKSLRESERLLKGRGISAGHLERSAEIAAELLAGGPRSRAELHARWAEAGLSQAQGANYHMTFQHIATGMLCYGPVVDGDQHIALTESWLPAGTGLEDRFNGDRDAACAELLDRYLTSRGPATLRDFSWWSKLSLGAARRAFALIRERFEELPGDEPRYQRVGLADEVAAAGRSASRPLLLPGLPGPPVRPHRTRPSETRPWQQWDVQTRRRAGRSRGGVVETGRNPWQTSPGTDPFRGPVVPVGVEFREGLPYLAIPHGVNSGSAPATRAFPVYDSRKKNGSAGPVEGSGVRRPGVRARLAEEERFNVV